MFKICMCTCLLLALTMVEMKVLNIKGRVGETVTFTCSNWSAWTDVKTKDKYLCYSPCKQDKHIIIKAAFSNSECKERIEIRNRAQGLFVTFKDLKLSDSQKYYCGVDRFGLDSFIEVDLKVIDDHRVKIATVGSKVSFALRTTSTVSSSLDVTTSSPVSYSSLYTASMATAVKGSGSEPYLIVGFTMTAVSLIVLLLLMRTLKRQHKIIRCFPPDSPQDNPQDVNNDNIRLEDQQTESQTTPSTAAHLSTANPDAYSESLYSTYSFLQNTEWNNYCDEDYSSTIISEVYPKRACAESVVTGPLDDMVYSLAQLPKERTEVSAQSDLTEHISN